MLRVQPSIRRLEVIGVIGIPGKMDASELAGPAQFELVAIQQNPAETPKALTYVELGDLDHPNLLRDEKLAPRILLRRFHLLEADARLDEVVPEIVPAAPLARLSTDGSRTMSQCRRDTLPTD